MKFPLIQLSTLIQHLLDLMNRLQHKVLNWNISSYLALRAQGGEILVNTNYVLFIISGEQHTFLSVLN